MAKSIVWITDADGERISGVTVEDDGKLSFGVEITTYAEDGNGNLRGFLTVEEGPTPGEFHAHGEPLARLVGV